MEVTSRPEDKRLGPLAGYCDEDRGCSVLGGGDAAAGQPRGEGEGVRRAGVLGGGDGFNRGFFMGEGFVRSRPSVWFRRRGTRYLK
jgi:hypothetical protein